MLERARDQDRYHQLSLTVVQGRGHQSADLGSAYLLAQRFGEHRGDVHGQRFAGEIDGSRAREAAAVQDGLQVVGHGDSVPDVEVAGQRRNAGIALRLGVGGPAQELADRRQFVHHVGAGQLAVVEVEADLAVEAAAVGVRGSGGVVGGGEGAGAGPAGRAVGTTCQEPGAFTSARFAGVCNCCNSSTLSLSALSVNCTSECGVAKFFSVMLPVAVVWPMPAFTFSSAMELWLNVTSELAIFTGLVRPGSLSVEFWILPLPLKFRAAMFFVGPWAWTSRSSVPSPVMPSTAVTP